MNRAQEQSAKAKQRADESGRTAELEAKRREAGERRASKLVDAMKLLQGISDKSRAARLAEIMEARRERLELARAARLSQDHASRTQSPPEPAVGKS